MQKWILLLIVLLALSLRVVGISKYPTGFTADEASFGYDAYSILKTGKDQWGASFPLALRSFGDFKLPLYTYIAIPSVSIFGLNEFAVRLPGALLGAASIITTYLFVQEFFRNKKLALLSAFLLAVSPWNISLSRGAFESNLTTFFITGGLWAFLVGMRKKPFMYLAAIFFGLNLFTYHSARIFTPILIFALAYFKRREFSLNKYKIPIFVFGIFLAVSLYAMFFGGGSRASDVAIFNPTDKWASVADERFMAVKLGLPDKIARIFSNKTVYVARTFTQTYITYLSPQFLFLEGAGSATYGMVPGQGLLYSIEILFLGASLIYLIRKKDANLSFILIWILLSIIPASLSKGFGYAANRAATMMPAIQIFSAFGFLVVLDVLKSKMFKKAVFILIFISLAFFLERYLYQAPARFANAMSYGWKDGVATLKTLESNNKKIIISRSFSEPQIFIAFYGKIDPSFYQKESQDWMRYASENKPFVDQLGQYKLGNYQFSDINYQSMRGKTGIILVGKPEEFPQGIRTIKTILYPDGKPAMLIVDPAI